MGAKITADEIASIIKERVDNFELNIDLKGEKVEVKIIPDEISVVAKKIIENFERNFKSLFVANSIKVSNFKGYHRNYLKTG